MNDEQYEAKRKELQAEIRQQEYKVMDARLAMEHEAKKLVELQRRLQYLHLETDDT